MLLEWAPLMHQAIASRCGTVDLPKKAIKISGVLKPALNGKRFHRDVIRSENMGGVFDPDLVHVLRGCKAQKLLGRPADMLVAAPAGLDKRG